MRNHIISLLDKGMRLDGRKADEYRKDIKVEYGVAKLAEGSARVTIGKTEVIAGVKMEVMDPFSDTPDEGVIMVGEELLPLSNPAFEAGPPSIEAIELGRVVDRGIRESHALEMNKLCIISGEKVWAVSIDICPINDAGNLFDASALAAIAALQDTKLPEYDGKKIDYKKLTDKKLPLVALPIGVTVIKLGKHYIVDPLYDEQKVADARLTVASTADGMLCALQKGGVEPLTAEDITKIVQLGLEKAKFLREKVKQ
ncbi:exosome complex protein Rrp42 [Candidatus Woesearchaeota archaeon]|nr:exosome complex protein Rrp42 [Candidatus Woesearchaeota archaeon]